MEKNPEIGFEKTGIALSSGIYNQCCPRESDKGRKQKKRKVKKWQMK